MDLKNKLFMRFIGEVGGGGTKYTSDQLAVFRVRWHQFVEIRQILGTCIQCNRKHQRGMQRCGVHRNKNKAKCLKWARDNRASIRAEYRARVARKVCVNNPAHGPTYDGHIKCKSCFLRHKKARNAKT